MMDEVRDICLYELMNKLCRQLNIYRLVANKYTRYCAQRMQQTTKLQSPVLMWHFILMCLVRGASISRLSSSATAIKGERKHSSAFCT